MLQKYKDNVYTTTLSQFRPNFAKGILRSKGFKGIQVCSFGFFSKELGPCYFPGEAILAIYIKTHYDIEKCKF